MSSLFSCEYFGDFCVLTQPEGFYVDIAAYSVEVEVI